MITPSAAPNKRPTPKVDSWATLVSAESDIGMNSRDTELQHLLEKEKDSGRFPIIKHDMANAPDKMSPVKNPMGAVLSSNMRGSYSVMI
jgi:hypothetical protein